MPDGNADVSIKPDELKALKPRLEEIQSAIKQMGEYLAKNDTAPSCFGLTQNAPAAGSFFVDRRTALADTSLAVNFMQTFTDAILAAAEGSEETEKEMSAKFKKIHGGE